MEFRVGDIVEDTFYPGVYHLVVGVLTSCLCVIDMETGSGMAASVRRFRIVESSQPSVAYMELFQ